MEIQNNTVYIANIYQLRAMKLECNRPIDRVDVELMDEYIKIRNSDHR